MVQPLQRLFDTNKQASRDKNIQMYIHIIHAYSIVFPIKLNTPNLKSLNQAKNIPVFLQSKFGANWTFNRLYLAWRDL